MASNRQTSFAQVEWEGRARRTRRAEFLAQMDSVVPWADLLALVEPPGTGAGRRGRQPWPAETLPGMHLALVLAGPVRRRLRGHPEGPREGPGDVRGGRRGPNMTERWFLGGLCWLLPRRRRQPSGGGARAEPVFPTKGEVATEGASPTHHGG